MHGATMTFIEHNSLLLFLNATCFGRKQSSPGILLTDLKNQGKIFLFEMYRNILPWFLRIGRRMPED